MIELRNISKIYKTANYKIIAVSIENLNFFYSKFYAIVGPSGSGKSTLLHLIAGLDRPDNGVIIVNNKNITELKNDELSKFRNENIGIIFQKDNLIEELTIVENLRIILDLNDKSENYKMITTLLEDFKILAAADKFPNELSGGERQRISIIRALILQPKIIIADEPTANLDSENAKYIFQLLKNIVKDNSLVIAATHDLIIKNYCDEIINLKDGKII
ncbi:MAG TPA: ABC transporter ATP-binding protein [bacterium]|nr:ABC transporter ATP-binding protein [bacterium]